MNFQTIWTIARRELKYYFNTPIAYIVTIAFILPMYFLFFRTALIMGEASLRPFFDLFPWFMLLLAPALTMRSLAEEKKRQTFDLLIAHPINEFEVVVGKFLSSWLFMGLLLAITVTIPLSLGQFADLDYGQIFAQYLGGWLVSAGFLAVGILISGWVSNVVSSFLVAAGVCFGWMIMGIEIVTLAIPYPFNVILQELSILGHTEQFSRGVIPLRDIVYFVAVIVVLLVLAAVKLMEPKLVENREKLSKIYIAAAMVLAIGVVSHLILDEYPLRLDLTRNHLYTLSSATKQTLQEIPDILTINFYTSRELPAPVQVQKQFVEDVLADYVRFGNDNVRLSVINPETNPQLAQEAATAGIRQIEFNTISNNRYEVEAGYLGISVAYGDEQESIGYVQDPGNLEYELTRRIRKLTRDDQKTIGVVTGLGEKSQATDYTRLAAALETEYIMESVNLSDEEADLSGYDGLLVVGPTQPINATSSAGIAMKQYLAEGGNAMLLIDQVEPQYQLGVATLLETGWSELLNDVYGVRLEDKIAYDVELNQPIRVGNDFLGYLVNYPFWVNAVANRDFPPISGVNSVTTGWPAPIEVTQREGIEVIPLLRTSDAGGSIEGTLSIAPDSLPEQGQDVELLLGVAVSQENGGKVVIVGDSDLALDSFTQYVEGNVAFVSNAIDWVLAEEGVATVPRKNFSPPVLQFGNSQETENKVAMLQYGNLLGVPAVIGLGGFGYLRRRKKLSERTYESTS